MNMMAKTCSWIELQPGIRKWHLPTIQGVSIVIIMRARLTRSKSHRPGEELVLILLLVFLVTFVSVKFQTQPANLHSDDWHQ